MIAVADIKAWINLEDLDEHDALLTSLETRAVSYLENRIGQHLDGETTITELLSGRANRTVWTTNRINTLTSIEVRSIWNQEFEFEDLDDYEAVIGGHAIRSLIGRFPAGFANVRVVYGTGFASGAAPGDLQQAIFELVETWFRERVVTGGGQIAFRDASTEIPRTPRTIEQVIETYRRLPGT